MENEIARMVKDEIDQMIASGAFQKIVIAEIKRQLPKNTGS